MYCSNCGKEMAKEAQICPSCGAENSSCLQRESASNVKSPSARKNKIVLWSILTTLSIALFISYLIYDNDQVKLKYEWGTERKSISSQRHTHCGTLVVVEMEGVCESDKKHKVDRIKEFEIIDKVSYDFLDSKLVAVSYDFKDKNMTYDQIVKIAAKYYGDDYYQKWEKYTYWWQDGTVVYLTKGNICYYSEEYYIENASWVYEDVFEYFNKQ